MTEQQIQELSEEQLISLLESLTEDLQNDDTTRRDVAEDLFALLSFEDGVIVSEGPLRGEGRMSFGRKREGMRGVGLFLPANPVEEAVETRRGSAD